MKTRHTTLRGIAALAVVAAALVASACATRPGSQPAAGAAAKAPAGAFAKIPPNKDNDLNASFIQPFFSYTTPTAWTFTLQAEATYDWESEQWNIPAAAMVSKVTKIGNQLVQLLILRHGRRLRTHARHGFGNHLDDRFGEGQPRGPREQEQRQYDKQVSHHRIP